MSNRTREYLQTFAAAAEQIDHGKVESMIELLVRLRSVRGRLFCIGVGGSAANASHATADFRNACGIDAICPTDSIAEFTARANDDGLDSVFSGYMGVSRVGPNDMVLILSVGGGDPERNISTNVARAIDTARAAGAMVLAIVGLATGRAYAAADLCILVPCPDPRFLTPLAESFQLLLLHLITTDPRLCLKPAKWESVL